MSEHEKCAKCGEAGRQFQSRIRCSGNDCISATDWETWDLINRLARIGQRVEDDALAEKIALDECAKATPSILQSAGLAPRDAIMAYRVRLRERGE